MNVRKKGGPGPGHGDQASRGQSSLRARDAGERRRRSNGRRAKDTKLIADARVTHERQRLAADVHDLVMQDLSLALATVRSIAHDPSHAAEQARTAVAACERAVAAARRIVGELGDRELRPVSEQVERGAREAARGVPLAFHTSLTADARADQPTADALVHIAREAVTNAVKHGLAQSISVGLSHDEEWHLAVLDDGRGFDARTADPGFGLSSMRLQAETLGGTIALQSALGEGTAIEVSLP